MDTKILKLAFLGGAYDSAVGRVHRTAVEMDNRFQLVCGCFSLNEDSNKYSAIKYNVSQNRVYRKFEELIDNEAGNIDALVILTPTDRHKEFIIAAADKGIPVISEKALATSSTEAIDVSSHISQSKNGFLAVTYNYTGYPMLRELKYFIDQGVFGAVQQIHIEMPQEGFGRLDNDGSPIVPQEWRLSDKRVPIVSLDLGIHLHNIISFLTGSHPVDVVATSDSYGNFQQIIDTVNCIIRYEDGFHCSAWYSKVAHGSRNGLKVRLYGSSGSAEWIQEDPEHLLIADNMGKRFICDRANPDVRIANQDRYTRFKAGHPAGFIEAFANYYYDVADALVAHQNGEDYLDNAYVFGVDHAIEGAKLLEAIADSSIQRSWVKLS